MMIKERPKPRRIKSWFVKWITGYDPVTFEATLASLRESTPSNSFGLDDNYLFDFKNFSSQYNFNTSLSGVITAGTIPIATMDGANGDFSQGAITEEEANRQAIEAPNIAIGMPDVSDSSASTKIRIKPIDVLQELETVPTPFSLTLLDEKTEILKDKEKLIVQNYAKREISALIERLENRKRYMEHKAYFDRFQNTTDAKIAVILKKYDHLVMKTSDIFVPEFPNDAVQTMKEYTEKVDIICGKKPVFYVIADVNDFKKIYDQRDPILIVQSPFGFFWQILGAWDKEMLLLSEF